MTVIFIYFTCVINYTMRRANLAIISPYCIGALKEGQLSSERYIQ
ncbi:MAG: hypothetical protein ACTSPS_09660 [Promethearchaeota archaeon]